MTGVRYGTRTYIYKALMGLFTNLTIGGPRNRSQLRNTFNFKRLFFIFSIPVTALADIMCNGAAQPSPYRRWWAILSYDSIPWTPYKKSVTISFNKGWLTRFMMFFLN